MVYSHSLCLDFDLKLNGGSAHDDDRFVQVVLSTREVCASLSFIPYVYVKEKERNESCINLLAY